MRAFLSLLALASLWSASPLIAADSPAAASMPGIVIVKSFEAGEGFDYTYGSWRQQIVTSDEGVIIAGQSTAKGGAGGTIVADISQSQSIFVTLRRLPENRAGVVNLILMDKAGHGAGFTLNLARVGPDWTVLQVNIAQQSFKPPGMQPGPDWRAIQGYQVQGNHANELPVAIQLREITAAPPPPLALAP